MEEFLEAIRPSFWQGDYNFLWIYVFAIVFLVTIYKKIYGKYKKSVVFSPSRVEKHSKGHREAWEKIQRDLDALAKSEIPKRTSKAEEEKSESDPNSIPEPAQEEKKEKHSKHQEVDSDDPVEKLKKKADYFNSSSTSKTYKPSIRDRYPQITKRKGG